MRLSLLTLFFCLLALPGTPRAQAAPQEEPGKLISLLASKDRTVPKRAILERLLENRKAHLPEIRKAALQGGQEIRMMALRLLAEIRDPQAARIAGDSLDSDDVSIRRRAGSSLMILEDTTQLARVIERLGVEDDTGALKSLIAAAGSSGKVEAAGSLRPFLRHANQSVRVNTAIALARLGSMEGLETILEGLESADQQARREAVYGLGFFAGRKEAARAVARQIINNPVGTWKGEAGISLLRLRLDGIPAKLKPLTEAAAGGHPRVQAWAIQEIAALKEAGAAAWLKQRALQDDALGRFAALKLLMKGATADAEK
ncbi:MAG: HEAT repeat domain-containing protein [Planctomycetota bacterium]|nr:HEAT repeat domain-containing protein [Planctomycetota bacterium]